MKFLVREQSEQHVLSLPVRGAWIEIPSCFPICWNCLSLPVRGAWIEICYTPYVSISKKSLPVRGAWIEISMVTGKSASA